MGTKHLPRGMCPVVLCEATRGRLSYMPHGGHDDKKRSQRWFCQLVSPGCFSNTGEEQTEHSGTLAKPQQDTPGDCGRGVVVGGRSAHFVAQGGERSLGIIKTRTSCPYLQGTRKTWPKGEDSSPSSSHDARDMSASSLTRPP